MSPSRTSVVTTSPTGRRRAGSDKSVEALIQAFGIALHRFGTASHRLEEALNLLSRHYGVKGQFFCTPTAIFASFGEGFEQRSRLLRVEPGELDLDKLHRLEMLLEGVLGGGISPRRGLEEVEAVLRSPPLYPAWLRTLGFGLSSASGAHFFGGGPWDVAAAGGLGLLTGLMAWFAGSGNRWSRLFEPMAAVVLATLATLLAAKTGLVSVYLITAAGLLFLLPGLSLTVALRELASRNLVSGSARLAGSMMVLMVLGFGFAIGVTLGTALAGGAPSQITPGHLPWFDLPALTLGAVGITILLGADRREFFWALLSGAIAIYGARLGAEWIGPQLGPFVGALLVGTASNLYSRAMRRPAPVSQIPGLILLVPGSLGLRSISFLFEQDAILGIEAAFSVALIAIGLVTGLLIANVLVAPSGRLD